MPPLDILCEDGPLIAVNKPAGLPTQGVPDSVPSLEAGVKDYLRQKYAKSGNVYLGVPHRLDRPVSGVMIFARNSKAAARLAEQFRLRQVRKWYLAVIESKLDAPKPGSSSSRASLHAVDPVSRDAEGFRSGARFQPLILTDWMRKIPDIAQAEIVPPDTPGAKRASLTYRVLQSTEHHSLILVELHTGRMHQIRLQFASRGWPIVGDVRYGAAQPAIPGADESIALHAARLDLKHPIRYDAVSLRAPLPDVWKAFGWDAVDFDAFDQMTTTDDQTAGA